MTQSKAGSGQRAHGGQGGHLVASKLSEDWTIGSGHFGHTGGTTWDFNIYKSSSPEGIWERGIPGGKEL